MPAVERPVIRLIANHLPPYMIISKTEKGSSYAGFEHDLTQILAKTLGVTYDYYECDWSACMRALRDGNVDMAHSLLYSSTRAAFLEFVPPAYLKDVHSTVFYQRYDDKRVIDEFKDLQQDNFVIGYVGSTVYFEKFEQADNLLKMDVKNRETGIELLIAGRIDVLAGFDTLFDGVEFKSPHLKRIMKKSIYQPSTVLESFTVISKASPLFEHREDISSALQELSDNGVLTKISEKWIPKSNIIQ
ncbi:substrate-binding periplasmic protein [Planctobacterium marinum]|uniref:substrate-binding periplasmic protein n=1 Tax=Planctobacterium marinum TaxID=1631968 RepID=UPI001E4BC10A|nr:transporter substrate-binding domain-containing protein [Planctobacterium marinum]MCC2603767.1 transporter substrate-binding domain-containing protein [Planctobacterium marinum]